MPVVRKLLAFEMVSLDGYFVDARGDMRWAKNTAADPEFDAFTTRNAEGGGVLLFGRVTYEMMAGYWPTPLARQTSPQVARRMNEGAKVVFSHTLREASWANTTILAGDAADEVRRLKRDAGPGLAILGSGTIVSRLAGEGLIDEFQLVVIPVVLGAGRTPFAGIRERLDLALTR
jgi:dihydrofolate reductase